MFWFWIWKITITPAEEEYEEYIPFIRPEFWEEMSWWSREERYKKWVFETIKRKIWRDDIYWVFILYKPFKEELAKIEAQWVKNLIKQAEENTDIDDIYFYFD